MNNSMMLRIILFFSGLLIAGIGGIILLMPVTYFATNGIELGGNITLLNEIRAPGGALLAGGVLIMSGAFIAKLTFTAAVTACLLYLSYGMSRIFSMVVDGMPESGLLAAAALEIAIGLLALFALLRCRENERPNALS